MSARPKSALNAMDDALNVLIQHSRCSYAPLLQDRAQRNSLAQICTDRVEQATGGNTSVARSILEDFVRAVSQHSKRSWRGPIHYVYARHLADAFRRILDDGTSPAVALGIRSSKPGRRKGAATHNPQALAAAYWLLRRKGCAPEKCIKLLHELTGADRTTVQGAREARYTKAFSHPELLTDRQLKAKLRNWRHVKAFLMLLRIAGPGGEGSAVKIPEIPAAANSG